MTFMMTPPNKPDYQAMLQDYMSEPDDDGFSGDVLAVIGARDIAQRSHGRRARARLGFVMGGCFMGGILAAVQLKPAWALLAETTIPAGLLTLGTVFTIFAFAVWNSLDNRDAGIL